MTATQTLEGFNLQLPLIGTILRRDQGAKTIDIETRSGNVFHVHIRATTWFDAVQNLDRLDRSPWAAHSSDTGEDGRPVDERGQPWHWLRPGDLVAVEGIYSRHGDLESYDALTVHCLIGHKKRYLFEDTFWWIEQINCMANRWLDNLFGDKSITHIDDYTKLYRTTLNIEGMPVEQEGDIQEMATLSRLIYGLASAYLLTGERRFLLAAREGVAFQREAFRSRSADGRFCFWYHARKRDRYGKYAILECQFDDDRGSIPLYEQIYALAGLAQYFRVTQEWEVLDDIRRTIHTFNTFFSDSRDPSRPKGNFYSHIHPVTFLQRDDQRLNLAHRSADNRSQKNWNSIGDHLPAYLINLLLALDPLPVIDPADHDKDKFMEELTLFRATCRQILDDTANLIVTQFPSSDNAFVRERFDQDWNPINDWGWQQNRAIVGHNLKIAWNLTRVANYYRSENRIEDAERMFAVAMKLGLDMARVGIDQIRSGVFDAVERTPENGMPVQFAWLNTRDFWQQEQGILAYLILFGYAAMTLQDGVTSETTAHFLKLTRELQAFWNLYFLDRERSGIFFRISDNGTPVIHSTYGDKGGHSISGYHVFELCYLAHIYQRTYLPLPMEKRSHSGLVLHFEPELNSRFLSINVLPDFLGPDSLEVVEVRVDGIIRKVENPADFQIRLHRQDFGRSIQVKLQQTEKLNDLLAPIAVADDRPL